MAAAAPFIINGATADAAAQTSAAPGGNVSNGDFAFSYDERGVSLLRNPLDPFGATLRTKTGRLGLTLNYKPAGAAMWSSVTARGPLKPSADGNGVTYSTAGSTAPLVVNETYSITSAAGSPAGGTALDWTIDLAARGEAVHVGDVGISIPAQGTNGDLWIPDAVGRELRRDAPDALRRRPLRRARGSRYDAAVGSHGAILAAHQSARPIGHR